LQKRRISLIVLNACFPEKFKTRSPQYFSSVLRYDAGQRPFRKSFEASPSIASKRSARNRSVLARTVRSKPRGRASRPVNEIYYASFVRMLRMKIRREARCLPYVVHCGTGIEKRFTSSGKFRQPPNVRSPIAPEVMNSHIEWGSTISSLFNSVNRGPRSVVALQLC
jgi:hypothetical protein